MAIYITLRKNILNDSFTPQYITMSQKQTQLDRVRNTVCNTGGNFLFGSHTHSVFKSLIRHSLLSFIKTISSGWTAKVWQDCPTFSKPTLHSQFIFCLFTFLSIYIFVHLSRGTVPVTVFFFFFSFLCQISDKRMCMQMVSVQII